MTDNSVILDIKTNDTPLFFKKYIYTILPIISTILLFLSIIIIDQISSGSNPWNTKNNSSDKRCEWTHPNNFMQEKSNALSSLSFICVGIYLMLSVVYSYKKFISGKYNWHDFYIIQILFSITMIGSGISSFIYHSSGGDKGGFLDVWFIFNLFILLFFMGIIQIFWIGKSVYHNSCKISVIIVFVCIILSFIFTNYDIDFFVLRMVLIIALFCLLIMWCYGVYLSYSRRINPNKICLVYMSIFLLFTGIAVWYPEEINGKCLGLHLHSVWHIFIALSLLFLCGWTNSLGVPFYSLFLVVGENSEINFRRVSPVSHVNAIV
jgi:hypothetical protein